MGQSAALKRSAWVIGITAVVFVALLLGAFGLFPPPIVLIIVLPPGFIVVDYLVKKMLKLNEWTFGADLAFAGFVLAASSFAGGLAGGEVYDNQRVASCLARCGIGFLLWLGSVGFLTVEVTPEAPIIELFTLASGDRARDLSVLLGIVSYCIQQVLVLRAF